MPLWSHSLKLGFVKAKAALPLMLLPFAVDALVLLLNPALLPEDPSVEFTLPMPFPSLSQATGQSWGALPFLPLYPPWDLGQLTTPVLLAFLGGLSFLSAGYLGSLEAVRVGGPLRNFPRMAITLFSRIFAFNALVAVIVLVPMPFLEGYPSGLPTSLFVLLALLVVLYFLFLTPFCIAVSGFPLGPAIRRSVGLAYRSWRQVLPYCLAYAGITALTSFVVLLLLTVLPSVPGILLAAGLYGTTGTALVISSLYLYESLVPEEPLPTDAPARAPAEDAAPA